MDSSEYSITMLGEFTISYKDCKVSEQSNRSKKLWNILEYLITNRDRSISREEIIGLLWEEEKSDNPSGALKVLIHRVRKCLEPLETDSGRELIVLNRGEYAWSPEAGCSIDTVLFEDLCRQASDDSLPEEERIELSLQAFRLYRGNFLSRNSEPWVVPIAEFYRKMYLELIYGLLAMLDRRADYGQMEQVCRKAVTIGDSCEKLYYYLIKALYKSGRQSEALREYGEVTNLFYRRFGITPSDEVKSLYRMIQKSSANTAEQDINTVKEALREKDGASGAFFCEFEFFKDMYRLESRACARSGDSIFLCLVTLIPTSDDPLPVKNTNKAMEDAQAAIAETLRKGDIFARYSVTQFVLLLPTATFENVETIMKRISSVYGRRHAKKDIVIQYKMQAIDPY